MNNGLEYFVNNKDDLLATKENIITGNKYRFTILSERLIRIEYNSSGIFENRASANVIFRKFPKVNYTSDTSESLLQITTSYFTLNYVKEKPIVKSKVNGTGNLQIILNGSDKAWYYGHPGVRNYGGITFSLDDFKKNLKFDKGLYSTDGFVCLDDSNTYLINEDGSIANRNKDSLDLYVFFYKKDLGLCLQDYYKLTGYPLLIPRYALGVWWYKNKSYTNEELSSLLTSFYEEKISLGGIFLGDRCLSNDDIYEFNNINVTGLKNVLNKINASLGVVFNPNYIIKNNTTTYQNLSNLINNNNIDLTKLDDNTLNTVLNYGIRNYLNNGIESFYIDYNNINNKEYLSKVVNYFYANTAKLTNKRSFVMSRNHGFAPHRNTVIFLGNTNVDWNTLEVLPRYFSTASNNGVSFVGSPIGGFRGGVENFELYIRYIQLGVFSSIFVLASDYCKYYRREPWRWNDSEKAMIKKYLDLRNKLIPYIYTESYIYSTTGSPLIQPLYYKYPKIYDEPLYKNQYFFGKNMLVCPITKKKNLIMNRVVQRLFIPEGTWYEFESGKKYAGNKYYMSFYKDEDYPVFCREGSIIVMGQNNNTNLPTDLEVVIFPGSDGKYELYEDDGISNEYKNGNYSITEYNFNYQENSYLLSIKNTRNSGTLPSGRNYKIIFKNTKSANVSIFNNTNKIEGNIYLEKNNLIVEVPDIATSSELSIKINSNEMIMNSTIRLINDDIRGILEDLEIETTLKEKIDEILFGDLPIKKKRIAIRKLKKHKLEPKFIKMFLNLLEYIKTV